VLIRTVVLDPGVEACLFQTLQGATRCLSEIAKLLPQNLQIPLRRYESGPTQRQRAVIVGNAFHGPQQARVVLGAVVDAAALPDGLNPFHVPCVEELVRDELQGAFVGRPWSEAESRHHEGRRGPMLEPTPSAI